MRRTLVILLEAELLDRGRRSWLARGLRVQLPGLLGSLVLQAIPLGALLVVLYGTPLVISEAASRVFDEAAIAATRVGFNVLAVFFFYFGLFCGAYLRCDQVAVENESLLALPISRIDVARLRLSEVVRSALVTALLMALPLSGFYCRAIGCNRAETLVLGLSYLLALLTVFLLGLELMVALLVRLRLGRSENVFLGVFLGSIWAFVVAVQLAKLWGPSSAPARALSGLVGSSRFSLVGLYSGILGGVYRPIAVLTALSVSLVPVLAALLFAVDGALARASMLASEGSNGCPSRAWRGLATGACGLQRRTAYFRTYRSLKFLPLVMRAMIARDITAAVRRPFRLLRLIAVGAPLVLVPLVKRGMVVDPMAFLVYFFSTFFVFRLFGESVAEDRKHFVAIRQAVGGAVGYFRMRIAIVFVGALAFLVPAWVGMWVLWGPKLSSVAALNAVLAVLNVMAATLLVVGLSLTGRVGVEDGWAIENSSIDSLYRVSFWIVGTASTAAFYYLYLFLRPLASSL